jgi:pimeloyl-ACP methyl ester carboxylesterase
MNSKRIANLNVQSGGSHSGPTILLLHGVTRQIADLAPFIDQFPREYGWIAVDFPGHGKSPPANHQYKVRDYSTDIVRLVEALDQPSLILFGNSLGAMVAAEVASLLPKRITAAILEEPPFSTMGAKLKESSFELQFSGVSKLLRQRFPVEELFQALRELPVRRPSDGSVVRFGDLRDDASLRTYASYLMEVDPRVLDSVVAGQWLEGYDFEAIAARVHCPMLLLQGEAKFGAMLTDHEAKGFESRAANCQLKKFADAGHLIHTSHTLVLAKELFRFLQSVVPPAS